MLRRRHRVRRDGDRRGSGARDETGQAHRYGGSHRGRARSGSEDRSRHRDRRDPRRPADDHEAGKSDPRQLRERGVVRDQSDQPIGRGGASHLGMRRIASRSDAGVGRNGAGNSALLGDQLARGSRHSPVQAPGRSRGVAQRGRHERGYGPGARHRDPHGACQGHDYQSGAEFRCRISPADRGCQAARSRISRAG